MAVTLAGVSLLLCGLGMAYIRHKATRDQPDNRSHSNIHSSDNPSEAPVSREMPRIADQPFRIMAPSISINGYVERVGLNDRNEIGTPSNINLAGWYGGSAKPGQPGISIIDGHVQGRYQPGIFKRLAELRSNDPIQVEYGDGSVISFTVRQAISLPEDKAAAALHTKLPGVSRQLNIITCSGPFDRSSSHYTERHIIYAVAATP